MEIYKTIEMMNSYFNFTPIAPSSHKNHECKK